MKFTTEQEESKDDIDNFEYTDFACSLVNFKFVEIPVEEANLVYKLSTRLLIWYDLLKTLIEDRNQPAFADLVTTISRHLAEYYDPVKEEMDRQ